MMLFLVSKANITFDCSFCMQPLNLLGGLTFLGLYIFFRRLLGTDFQKFHIGKLHPVRCKDRLSRSCPSCLIRYRAFPNCHIPHH